mgnify:CR=1 FL=1
MKYRIVKYIGLAGTLLVGGCSDWLDVDPKSQIKQEVLFESEAGFRDALTGIYGYGANGNVRRERDDGFFRYGGAGVHGGFD